MHHKRITTYLNKIKNGQEINFNNFLSLLPEDLQEAVKSQAVVAFSKKGAVKVELSCEKIWQRLQALTLVPENRVSASLQGDSHKVNTSTSYLLAYHQHTLDIHPDTVICTNITSHNKFKPKRQLLIVENAELFFAKEALFTQMNKVFSLSLSFDNCDLVFGSGNQVANKLNHAFINQYTSVLCFFDYDFGGLKIFKAMKNMLGDKAQFIEPNNEAAEHLAKLFVKKPESSQQYLNALALANELGLTSLYALLEAEKLFMEQEALLALQ